MPDGGGEGHFRTMREIRETLADHARRLATVERDVIDLTDEVVKRRLPRRRRKPKR